MTLFVGAGLGTGCHTRWRKYNNWFKSSGNNSVLSPGFKSACGTLDRGHEQMKLIYVVRSQESGHLGAEVAEQPIS